MNTDLGQCVQYHPYDGRNRCPRPATGKLYAPDGEPVPGGRYCTECAGSIVSEYLEKLGEVWLFTLGDYPPKVTPC